MKKIFFLFTIGLTFLSNVYSQEHIVIFSVRNKKEIRQLPDYVSVDYVKDNQVRAYIWGDNIKKFQ